MRKSLRERTCIAELFTGVRKTHSVNTHNFWCSLWALHVYFKMPCICSKTLKDSTWTASEHCWRSSGSKTSLTLRSYLLLTCMPGIHTQPGPGKVSWLSCQNAWHTPFQKTVLRRISGAETLTGWTEDALQRTVSKRHWKTSIGTLRSKDATATRTSLKKWICVLSVLIAIIPTHLLCQL